MEGSNEEKLNSDEDVKNFVDRLGLDFEARLNFANGKVEQEGDEAMVDLSSEEEEEEEDEDEDEEEEDEEEFSFTFGGELLSPVAAEDAFANGQIKAVYPLFNQELLFAAGDSDSDSFGENLAIRPPVKVFVETVGQSAPANSSSSSSSAGGDDIAGPYCEWSSRKAVEAASEQACKKSNSTGFSRIWRFKEFVARCNSDGKDAFVFLNNNNAAHPPHAAAKKKPAEGSSAEGITRKVKKSGKSKPAPLSAHEAYLKCKAKEGQRRRRAPSYLPYRPMLVGFFTTVNGGGLTKNVHPF